MVHGLDLVFPNVLYQRLVVRCALPLAGTLVANSSATKMELSERAGIDLKDIVIVNPRLPSPPDAPSKAAARGELARRASLRLDERTLILATIGRLVRRKGVEWFVEHVIPRLPPQSVYLIAGEGPREGEIERLVREMSVGDRVKLLGRIDGEYREVLLRGADICVLPNIRVKGDMEGFGLVAVEAATRGTLVIASAIEGIQDAVIDDVTGVAVEAENPLAFAEAIDRFFCDRDLLERLANTYQRAASKRFLTNETGDGLLEALGLSGAPARRAR
jgi:glycosyltransferase involved in cell wall biosynthesis